MEAVTVGTVTEWRITDPKALGEFLKSRPEITAQARQAFRGVAVHLLQQSEAGDLPPGRLDRLFGVRPVSAVVVIAIDSDPDALAPVEIDPMVIGDDGAAYAFDEAYGSEWLPTPEQIAAATIAIRKSEAITVDSSGRFDQFEGFDGPGIREFSAGDLFSAMANCEAESESAGAERCHA